MSDITSLESAAKSLKSAFTQEYSEFTRDAAIQRFKNTFELSWKAMKRVLKDEGTETGSPKQVFRSAFDAKIIDDLELWFGFLKERDLTVHTYNENTAKEVYDSALNFPKEVDKLIKVLESR